MRAMTKKRAAQNRRYLQRRSVFLDANPRCAAFDLSLPGVTCQRHATTVQHAAGRRGSLLLDERFWLAMCWPCHSWADTHPVEAKRLALQVPRVGLTQENGAENRFVAGVA